MPTLAPPPRPRTAGASAALPAAILALALALNACAVVAHGATLPPHRQLRLLIVSDFVNPHALPPGDLVEPGDLSLAFRQAGSGLDLDPAADGVLEIPTNSIEQATALLALPASDPARYDVLVYFAHRIPDNGNGAQARQDAFTAAVLAFLQDGGGLVVYHHGLYLLPGKEGILELIGGTASGPVPWNTSEGQNVINVAPAHFVTSNGLSYPGTRAYADPARGVAAGTYPYFNNSPDERYLNFDLNAGVDPAEIEILFGSDYDEAGTTHLLGFTRRRPDWCGRVVAYQPGEYQPNMLDPVGANFQIIANEIVWSARAAIEPAPGVELKAVRGSLPGEAALSWTGGEPCWSLWRSADPTTILLPANRLIRTGTMAASDSPPPSSLWYWQVTSP